MEFWGDLLDFGGLFWDDVEVWSKGVEGAYSFFLRWKPHVNRRIGECIVVVWLEFRRRRLCVVGFMGAHEGFGVAVVVEVGVVVGHDCGIIL